MVILVTGAQGQVGQALQTVATLYPDFEFVFCNSRELNITDFKSCSEKIRAIKPAVIFNLAAYTAVDLAEDEADKAFEVNSKGVEHLAKLCRDLNITLVHLSTDFIFDGLKTNPYLETDLPNPINVYGASKWAGEQHIEQLLENYYIVRTSWVYSDFGSNFKNTMLRLAKERDTISVVNDQIGCPTNAVDLANALLKLIAKRAPYGVYNYCGKKSGSWYDFAMRIFKDAGVSITVLPIPTSAYPTKAKRPVYSVLDTKKWDAILGT